MKFCRTIVLFNEGRIMESIDWDHVHTSYRRSIESIDHPRGSGSLMLRRKAELDWKQWKRNGVKYLKNRFREHIVDVEGWKPEGTCDLGDALPPPVIKYPSMEKYQEPITSKMGGFDLVITAPFGTRVAIEWETGNISSSHRSMNKLAIALERAVVDAAVLIVPSRALYEHLTDRVGNISELSGYLQMWQSLGKSISRGLLAVTVVEHDQLTDDEDFPFLPVGNDGRASEGRSKI